MRSCDEGLIEKFDCIEQANFVTPVSPVISTVIACLSTFVRVSSVCRSIE